MTKKETMNFESMLSYGLALVGFGGARLEVTKQLNLKRFRAHFGIDPNAIIAIIKDLKIDVTDVKTNKQMKQVMMTLCWLKLYETEHVMAGRWGFGEEYCRETVKLVAGRIQALKKWKAHFGKILRDHERVFIGSVDCIHCKVNELRIDPNSVWFSHKHNGAGFTYEVVMDVTDDKVIWVAGPKPASTHDITFFRGGKEVGKNKKKNEAVWDKNALYFQIPDGKRLIGDSGYKGEPSKISVTSREHNEDSKIFFGRAKSRQETFNTRLKFFDVLAGRFRHGKQPKNKMELHKTCFEAVCVLVQYDMENGHPLFEI